MFICFTEAKGAYKGFLNGIAAYLTGGKYCHVVVVFETFDENDNLSFKECSIVRSKDEEYNRVHLSDVELMTGWTCYR